MVEMKAFLILILMNGNSITVTQRDFPTIEECRYVANAYDSGITARHKDLWGKWFIVTDAKCFEKGQILQ